jgi:hypothetical protein
MEPYEDEMLTLLDGEYIGDELTIEDLRSGYSAFVEDEKLEPREEIVAAEL